MACLYHDVSQACFDDCLLPAACPGEAIMNICQPAWPVLYELASLCSLAPGIVRCFHPIIPRANIIPLAMSVQVFEASGRSTSQDSLS